MFPIIITILYLQISWHPQIIDRSSRITRNSTNIQELLILSKHIHLPDVQLHLVFNLTNTDAQFIK